MINGTSITLFDYIITDFGLQLFATFVGAGLGFVSAFALERWKNQKETKETKLKLLRSTIKELEQIKSILDKENKLVWNSQHSTFDGIYSYHSLVSFENALYSGNLVMFSTDLQIELGLLHGKMKHYNFILEELFSIHKAGFADIKKIDLVGTRLINTMNTMDGEIKDEIIKIHKLIEEEFKKT